MANRKQKVEQTSVSKPCSNAMLAAGGSDPELLKRFMKEFFPYGEFRRAGVFTKGEDSKSYGRLVYSKKEARKELGNHSGRFIVRYKVRGSNFRKPKIIK